jgi:hypothetical protein
VFEFRVFISGVYWQGTQCSQALPLFLGIVPTPQLQTQALHALIANIAAHDSV